MRLNLKKISRVKSEKTIEEWKTDYDQVLSFGQHKTQRPETGIQNAESGNQIL